MATAPRTDGRTEADSPSWVDLSLSLSERLMRFEIEEKVKWNNGNLSVCPLGPGRGRGRVAVPRPR